MAYQIQHIDIAEVRLNDNNPRFIKDKSFKDLVKSLKECPDLFNARPLLCNAERVILGGNMRYRAALELRYTEVPVIIMDGLTPDQEREIVIKDNGGFGSWDFEALANGWADLPLAEWGVELPENWLSEPEEAPEEEDFNAELPKEPITVLGDLYELNGHRLHCADSTDSDAVAKLMDGKKADMVFTDPPYNVDFKGQELSNTTKNGVDVLHHKGANTKHDKIKNDAMPDEEFIDFMKAVLSNVSLFNSGAWYFSFCDLKLDLLLNPLKEMGFKWKSIIIWVKNQATLSGKDYKSRYEPIVYGCPESSFYGQRYEQEDIWEFQRTLKNDLHPTMKPIPLVENAIKNSSKTGMIIMDLFLGSGSTLIASEIQNRICYGQELGENYCDVIVRRWVKYMQDNNRPYTVKRNGQELSKAEIDQFFVE